MNGTAGNPDINPHKYALLVSNRGANIILWRTDGLSTNGVGAIGHPWAKNEYPPKPHTLYKTQATTTTKTKPVILKPKFENSVPKEKFLNCTSSKLKTFALQKTS